MDENLIKGDPIQGKTVENEPTEKLQTIVDQPEEGKNQPEAPVEQAIPPETPPVDQPE